MICFDACVLARAYNFTLRFKQIPPKVTSLKNDYRKYNSNFSTRNNLTQKQKQNVPSQNHLLAIKALEKEKLYKSS